MGEPSPYVTQSEKRHNSETQEAVNLSVLILWFPISGSIEWKNIPELDFPTNNLKTSSLGIITKVGECSNKISPL